MGRLLSESPKLCLEQDVQMVRKSYMCQGLNSHYFHIIGDGHQHIPIIRIPSLKVGGLPSPI